MSWRREKAGEARTFGQVTRCPTRIIRLSSSGSGSVRMRTQSHTAIAIISNGRARSGKKTGRTARLGPDRDRALKLLQKDGAPASHSQSALRT